MAADGNRRVGTTLNTLCSLDTGEASGTSARFDFLAYRDNDLAVFAPDVPGNLVEPCLSGDDYFRRVATAIKGAQKSIFITGWQINFDVYLIAPDADGRGGERLIDCLLEVMKRPVHIYLMPWYAPPGPVKTHSVETWLAVKMLNDGKLPGRAHCYTAPQNSAVGGAMNWLFSHHQKSVVVDNEIGFVGGIDLAYGRRDDGRFSLLASDDGRRGREMYNPGVPPMKVIDEARQKGFATFMQMANAALGATVVSAGGTINGVATSPLREVLRALSSAPAQSALANLQHDWVASQKTLARLVAELDNWSQQQLFDLEEGWLDVEAGSMNLASEVLHGTTAAVAGTLGDAYDSLSRVEWMPEALKSGDAILADDLRRIEAEARKSAAEGRTRRVRRYDALRRALREQRASYGANLPLREAAIFAWLADSPLHAIVPERMAGLQQDIGQFVVMLDAFIQQMKDVEGLALLRRLGKLQMLPDGTRDGMPAVLDAANQPRQPWQDVALQVRGPAVHDLAMNFIRRWNSQRENFKALATTSADLLLKGQYIKGITAVALRQQMIPVEIAASCVPPARDRFKPSPQPGKVRLQVLRSASSAMLRAEAAAAPLRGTPAAKAIGRLQGPQKDCQNAIIEIIGAAKDFVYIEGQFFQSDFGAPAGYPVGQHSGPTGTLVDLDFLSAERRQQLRVQKDAQGRVDLSRFDWDLYFALGGVAPPDGLGDVVLAGFSPPDLIRVNRLRARYGAFTPEERTRLNAVLKTLLMHAGLRRAGDEQTGLLNKVLDALGERLQQHILQKRTFHVYIALPVHPEGLLNDPTLMKQVHLTMQSLANGQHSLINRVRRAILMRRELDKSKDCPTAADYDRVVAKYRAMPVDEVERRAAGEEWRKWLTLLNLRNWQTLSSERTVTEQIYIHTKLVIVDDNYAVVGSCNINDRSQLGDRDSELAVLMHDEETEDAKLDGIHKSKVSKTVRQMRLGIWRKLLGGGTEAKSHNDKVRPASSALMKAIESPAAPATVEAIQKLADRNLDLYSSAAYFIPSNGPENRPTSIWPNWIYPTGTDPLTGYPISRGGTPSKRPLPFEDAFWSPTNLQDTSLKLEDLKKVQGFIVSLPRNWTKYENNDTGMHQTVVAVNEGSQSGSWT